MKWVRVHNLIIIAKYDKDAWLCSLYVVLCILCEYSLTVVRIQQNEKTPHRAIGQLKNYLPTHKRIMLFTLKKNQIFLFKNGFWEPRWIQSTKELARKNQLESWKKIILWEHEIINNHKQKSIETVKRKYEATLWRKSNGYNIITEQLICFKKKSLNWQPLVRVKESRPKNIRRLVGELLKWKRMLRWKISAFEALLQSLTINNMFLGSSYGRDLEHGRRYHLKASQVATEYGNYVLDRSSTIKG